MRESHTVKKPVNQDWHRADIKAALEKAGWTLRRLSFHHGFSDAVAKHALYKPYPRGQQIIADAIGIKPWEIWPSRYDENNQPKRERPSFPLYRPSNWVKPPGVEKPKHNKLVKECNVSKTESA